MEETVIKGILGEGPYKAIESEIRVYSYPIGGDTIFLDVDRIDLDGDVTSCVADLSKEAAIELAKGLLKFGGTVSSREAFESLIEENLFQITTYENSALYAGKPMKKVYLDLAEAHRKTVELLEAYIWEPEE